MSEHERLPGPCARAIALALVSLASVALAQNGTGGANFHILSNGFDAVYVGVGAGGLQTPLDGIGMWIPGEELKGSTRVAFSGDWGYRMTKFRETVCFRGPGPQPTDHIRFPLMLWFELDNRHDGSRNHGHNPAVFLHPSDPSCIGFPLGGSAGFVPYGVPSASTASFVLSSLPTSLTAAVPKGFKVLLPNEGLTLRSTHPDAGMATLIAAATGIDLDTNGTGGCWGVQLTWIPSAITSRDDVTGWWHYLANSPDGNQHWAMSTDELGLFQSNTVATDRGGTRLTTFFANVEYSYQIVSAVPVTGMTLLPLSDSPYAKQTENVFGSNPNGGFDVGRGSRNLSLSGTGGVPNPFTGFGSQDPTGTPLVPTIGFMTWDNVGHGGLGSDRVVWLTLDSDHFRPLMGLGPPLDPAQAGEVTRSGGSVRVPSPVPRLSLLGWPQRMTLSLLRAFQHTAAAAPSGWPDPDGFSSGAFDLPYIAGASAQVPITAFVSTPQCVGVPIAVAYGSSATGGMGGQLVWDPPGVYTSGTREFFILD